MLFLTIDFNVDIISFSLAVHPDKIRIATGQLAGVDKDGRVGLRNTISVIVFLPSTAYRAYACPLFLWYVLPSSHSDLQRDP